MSLGFGAGLSALSAARTAIQTIGHNMANATTPGYARERVLFQTIGGGLFGGHLVGGGVNVATIDRVTDDLLSRQVLRQKHEVGRRETLLQNLFEVEQVFGEPGEGGVAALLGDVFSRISGLEAAPDDGALRGSVSAIPALRPAHASRHGHSTQPGEVGVQTVAPRSITAWA